MEKLPPRWFQLPGLTVASKDLSVVAAHRPNDPPQVRRCGTASGWRQRTHDGKRVALYPYDFMRRPGSYQGTQDGPVNRYLKRQGTQHSDLNRVVVPHPILPGKAGAEMIRRYGALLPTASYKGVIRCSRAPAHATVT
jgi:hypothetical protein